MTGRIMCHSYKQNISAMKHCQSSKLSSWTSSSSGFMDVCTCRYITATFWTGVWSRTLWDKPPYWSLLHLKIALKATPSEFLLSNSVRLNGTLFLLSASFSVTVPGTSDTGRTQFQPALVTIPRIIFLCHKKGAFYSRVPRSHSRHDVFLFSSSDYTFNLCLIMLHA